MKELTLNITVILATLILSGFISLLLDWQFIQAYAIRKILVYILILVIIFIGSRLIYLLNKGK